MSTIVGASFAEGTGSVAVDVPSGTQKDDLLYAVIVGPESPGFDPFSGWRNLNPAGNNAASATPQSSYLGLPSSLHGLPGSAMVVTRYHDGRASYTLSADAFSASKKLIGGILAVRGPHAAIFDSAGSPNTRALFYQNGGVASGTRVYDSFLNPGTFTPGTDDQEYWYQTGGAADLPYPIDLPIGFVAHVLLFDDDPGAISFTSETACTIADYHTGAFDVSGIDIDGYKKMTLALGMSVPSSIDTHGTYQQWQSSSAEVSWAGAATDAKHVGWYSVVTETAQQLKVYIAIKHPTSPVTP